MVVWFIGPAANLSAAIFASFIGFAPDAVGGTRPFGVRS
jgi:hypothetical protein